MQETTNTSNPENSGTFLQRVGLAGFLFFFLKGLAWLSLPTLALLLR